MSVAVLAVLVAAPGTLGVASGRIPQPSPTTLAAALRDLPKDRGTKSCAGLVVTGPGAAARFGLDAAGVPAPLWSGSVGTVQGVSGGDVITTAGSDCVAAIDASSGRTLWVTAVRVRGSSGVEGLTADPRVVVVGLSQVMGRSPGMVYAAVDGLVGLDPVTGRRLWRMALDPDGQELPAVVEGSSVVVSKADGTVEGVRASSGVVTWSDPLPPRCGRTSTTGPLSPRASVLSAGRPAVVLYRCGVHEVIAALDPRTGRRAWTWNASRSVLWQAREVIGPTTPSPDGDGVVAIGEASIGRLGVPTRTWELDPNGAEGYDVAVLDLKTGRPLWVLRGVPTPATGAEPDVAVARGDLCVGHAADVECWMAKSGAPAWKWSAPQRRSSQLLDRMPGLALSGDEIFIAVPTAAAAEIDPESTTERSGPGTFVLVGFDLTDGAVVDSQGLPAYYGGPDTAVVSDTNPPDVRVALAGIVLLTPSKGSGVLEALRM